MKFTDHLSGNVATFTLSGKVVTQEDSVTRFHGRVSEYINLNKNRVVVDLDRVTTMGSIGLGMLLAARSTITRVGGRMVLANITNVQNLIALTRLNTVFESYDSVDEAVESFNYH